MDSGYSWVSRGEGIDWIGPLVVALILSVRARHIQDYESARRMFWLIIPFAALLFLVTPHFDASATGLSSIVVTNLQNASSVALLVCLWSLLLTASRTTGLSAVETFGVCFALITAAPIVGYVLYSLLGTVANTIAVIFFDLYTCATVIFLVLVGPDERESREVALNAIDAYIGPRCAALSAEYGLTARESEILLFLARGHSYSYVAESIYVSETTVRTHARNLYRKMGVGSQEDLIQLIDSAQGV